MECSDLSRWDFFIERFAWQTKKNWAFSVLVAAISAALHKSFVHSKYNYSVSQFLLYWMRIIWVFIKILFDNWRRFFRPSVPVKCPRGRGIWSPEWILVWGIWTAFWLGEGGIWTMIFKKVKCPGGCPGGMLKLRFDRYRNKIRLCQYPPILTKHAWSIKTGYHGSVWCDGVLIPLHLRLIVQSI